MKIVIKNDYQFLKDFEQLTDEQMGKVFRKLIFKTNETLDVNADETYQQILNNCEAKKESYSSRTQKGWETRRKNSQKSYYTEAQYKDQLQRDKEEMIKLRAENEALRSKKWYTPYHKKEKDIPQCLKGTIV